MLHAGHIHHRQSLDFSGSGHLLIPASLGLPLHGKSLPFTARPKSPVGSEAERNPLIMMFEKTHSSTRRGSFLDTKPCFHLAWLLATVGFGLGAPLEAVTMAAVDDKWGRRAWGGHQAIPSQRRPLTQPFSQTLDRSAWAYVTSCEAPGNGLAKMGWRLWQKNLELMELVGSGVEADASMKL